MCYRTGWLLILLRRRCEAGIYGWRGGVAELVDTVVGQLPNVAEEQLNCSYRSSQIVIDTVNTVFGMLAANPVLSPYPAVVSAWSRRFETHTTVHSDLPGHCRLVTAPAANEDEEQALVTLRWAAAEVAGLHREHPDRTIGILPGSQRVAVSVVCSHDPGRACALYDHCAVKTQRENHREDLPSS